VGGGGGRGRCCSVGPDLNKKNSVLAAYTPLYFLKKNKMK